MPRMLQKEGIAKHTHPLAVATSRDEKDLFLIPEEGKRTLAEGLSIRLNSPQKSLWRPMQLRRVVAVLASW